MASVCGEDCQDPIPAMLTLNWAELQGRDCTDPAQGTEASPAAVGAAQAASPAWSRLLGSPELMGTNVPSSVTGPQAHASTVLVGKNLWRL